MFGRGKRRQADELRARFVANRERVGSWVAGWECPEVAWPEVPAVPAPWSVGTGGERDWFERHAPFLDEYHWLLEGRPLADGITEFSGAWWFAAGHEFERLELRTRTVAHPGYLAERLATGVHAAGLKGWTDADLRPFHEWLFEGLDTRPMDDGVRGQTRFGFVLAELLRVPLATATGIGVALTVRLTGTALDGTPLNSDGEPVRRS